VASLLCLIIVSLFTAKPDPAQWRPFFK
jgi:hypothetical protein